MRSSAPTALVTLWANGLLPVSKTPVWDNAVMESFFSSLKTARTAGKMYRTRAQADVFDDIECCYNRRRRHFTLGYFSPMEFERRAELA